MYVVLQKGHLKTQYQKKKTVNLLQPETHYKLMKLGKISLHKCSAEPRSLVCWNKFIYKNVLEPGNLFSHHILMQ